MDEQVSTPDLRFAQSPDPTLAPPPTALFPLTELAPTDIVEIPESPSPDRVQLLLDLTDSDSVEPPRYELHEVLPSYTEVGPLTLKQLRQAARDRWILISIVAFLILAACGGAVAYFVLTRSNTGSDPIAISAGASLRLPSAASQAPVRALALSADGSRLYGGTDAGDVVAWDAASGAAMELETIPGTAVHALDLSSDESVVFVAGTNSSAGFLALTPDGTRVLLASGGIVELDAATGRIVNAHWPGSLNATALAFSPTGETLYTGHRNGSIIAWSFPSRTPKSLWSPPAVPSTPTAFLNPILSLTVSPSGSTLYTMTQSDAVPLAWDASTGVATQLPSPDSASPYYSRPMAPLTLSRDGRWAYAAGGNPIVAWNLVDGSVDVTPWGSAAQGAQDAVAAISVASAGEIYVGTYNLDVGRWIVA
ncbi:Quino protein amine dehydrogenase [Blyttiomyces helicus]|uniref:Quino protein amine dehydrogenase n=1 Tax=Blyttiomyces helicus TaxID=388810 RepID=A0A4P9W3U8_9FUNG|nr:Quino protein amine dehydrogenase [Blyttiomyces helicus]|eukprot:RKO85330.1 Quino protein amine dehydrogenase [Blyttiomyces helicus]